MNCPKCKAAIEKAHINIHTDIAQCTQCQHVFKISENIGLDVEDGFNINQPPSGAWFIQEAEQIRMGATTRSPMAFFLVPFMVVWSGGSIGGLYGSQLLKWDFDPLMSLFGIPFLIGSIIFWSFTLMTIWGKVELTLNQAGGSVFTGVGTLGMTNTFTWDEVNTIKESGSYYRYPGSQGSSLQIEGKKRISFGLGVNESRRYYLMRAFKTVLREKKQRN